jgi:sigma-B regulation protein RsbU (phosphoserine phosphatase)
MAMTSAAADQAFYDALLEDDPESLYEQAPCGYLSTDPDGKIVKANRTFAAMAGHPPEDLVGRRFADLLSAGGRIYHETHYAPMLRMQGTVREMAFELVRPDGTRLPVLVNAALQRRSDGQPRVVRIAVFDATERREYERELVRSLRRAERSEAQAKALARTLQQTLIPPTPPHIPGLDVSAAYRPAGDGEEVGGDFYDIFQIGTDDWVVTLGDVCGKGVDAAVITALVRHTLRALTVQMEAPDEVLHALNEVLVAHGTDRFCTVLLLRLRHDGDSWAVTSSAGGHPLPMRVAEGGGSISTVGTPGPLVGILSAPVFRSVTFRLNPGEALVLYTDGVTEGRSGQEFYGEERLIDSILEHTGSQTLWPASEIMEHVVAFQQGMPRDDIAIVTIRVPEQEGRPHD